MSALLALVGVVALLVPMMALNGWALMHLWQWFAVPLGVPGIGLAHAIGISAIVGFFKGVRTGKDDGWDWVLYGLFSPLFSFGIGWLVHTAWMPK